MSTETRVEIDIRGLDSMIAKFENADGMVRSHLQLAVNESLRKVKESARSESPVVTGRLRGGIEDFPGSEGLIGMVDSTVFYGEMVHRRNPFMVRGADKAREDVTSIFQRAVSNIKFALSS